MTPHLPNPLGGTRDTSTSRQTFGTSSGKRRPMPETRNALQPRATSPSGSFRQLNSRPSSMLAKVPPRTLSMPGASRRSQHHTYPSSRGANAHSFSSRSVSAETSDALRNAQKSRPSTPLLLTHSASTGARWSSSASRLATQAQPSSPHSTTSPLHWPEFDHTSLTDDDAKDTSNRTWTPRP